MHLYQPLPMSLNSELTCSTKSFRGGDCLLKQGQLLIYCSCFQKPVSLC